MAQWEAFRRMDRMIASWSLRALSAILRISRRNLRAKRFVKLDFRDIRSYFPYVITPYPSFLARIYDVSPLARLTFYVIGIGIVIHQPDLGVCRDFLDDIADEALREQRWKEVRGERGWRLRNCDWTQGVDSPLTSAQKTAWRTYRQALRDITNQDDPEKINWPTPPA